MRIAKDMIRKSMHGCVTITAQCDGSDERVVLAKSPNMIVNGIYPRIAHLLAHDDEVGSPITSISLGTNGAAVEVTDTLSSLGEIAGQLSPLVITFPSFNPAQVKAVGTYASGASSALDIKTVGLFAGTELLARYVFDTMRKSVGWTWTIEWILSY